MFKLNPIDCCIGTVCSVLSVGIAFAAVTKTPDGIIVNKDIKHDISLPLNYMQAKGNLLSAHRSGIKQIVAANTFGQAPTVLEPSFLISPSGFQGIGIGLGSYQVTSTRPDTAASVGLMQYVQWVNTDIGVFDKATGQPAAGFPKPGNTLWAGFGGPCETTNYGAPTVKYDQLASRWVLSQHAYSDPQGPFYQCVAVSTSEDATGSYHRYAFPVSLLSDNAKLGLWPDGYYLSMTGIDALSFNQEVCAMERDKMLNGQPASIQCKQFTSNQIGVLQPADLAGSVLPPVNNPEFFVALNPPGNLILLKFHVDFIDPNNTTTNFVTLAVNRFIEACADTHGKSCAIQPNTTNRLDVFSDRVSRFAYRQFPEYGSMVLVHTVQGPIPKIAPALRWYELRLLLGNPNFNPTVYQSSTITPDSKNRFIGSITIDRFTNIAIGYNVSSSLIYPSLELSSHNFNDPLNTTVINPLVTGHGSQVDGITSWGSSSAMVVDPVDNCTFWYTGEYLKTTGSMNWSTFIVKFKLAACA